MNTRIIGRENLKFLVRKYRTQTALAKNLASKLTQPVISAILRNKDGRHLRPDEARGIEDDLVIPHGWMLQPSLDNAWRLVVKFRTLDSTSRNIVDEMLNAMEQEK